MRRRKKHYIHLITEDGLLPIYNYPTTPVFMKFLEGAIRQGLVKPSDYVEDCYFILTKSKPIPLEDKNSKDLPYD